MTIRKRQLIDNREYMEIFENVVPETVTIKHNELTFKTEHDGDTIKSITHHIKIKMTMTIDVLD